MPKGNDVQPEILAIGDELSLLYSRVIHLLHSHEKDLPGKQHIPLDRLRGHLFSATLSMTSVEIAANEAGVPCRRKEQ